MFAPLAIAEKQDINQYLKSQSVDYAFILFTKTGCSYCDDQKSILSEFIKSVPWTIREINISVRPDVGRRFDVDVTPMLVLVSSVSDKYVPIARGVQTADDIKRITVRSIDALKASQKKEQIYLMNHLIADDSLPRYKI